MPGGINIPIAISFLLGLWEKWKCKKYLKQDMKFRDYR